MHPSGCTALASASAHRVCIFVCNLARFYPRQPLFLGAVVPFPPSSLSHSLSFFFPRSPHFRLHHAVSLSRSCSLLRFLTLLDDAYTVSPCSLLTFPARLQAPLFHRRPSLLLSSTHVLAPVPTTLLVRSSLFAHFCIRKALPYPKNNPRAARYIIRSTYVYTLVKEERRRGNTHGTQPTEVEPTAALRRPTPPLVSRFVLLLVSLHVNWQGLCRET